MKTLYVRATATDADDMVVVLELSPENLLKLARIEAAYEVAESTLRTPDDLGIEPTALEVLFRLPVYDEDDLIFPDPDEQNLGIDDWDVSDDVAADPEDKPEQQSVDYVILAAGADGFLFRVMLHHATTEYSTEEVPWSFQDPPDAEVA